MYIYCDYIRGYISLEVYKNSEDKEDMWRYQRRNYWDFILDVLNKNIFSLVDGYSYIINYLINNSMENDLKIEFKNRNEINSCFQNIIEQNPKYKNKYEEHSHLVLKDLNILYLHTNKEMVDNVLLYDPNSDLTVLKKYYAYKSAYNFKGIEYNAKCHANFDFVYKDGIQQFLTFCELFQLDSEGKTSKEQFDEICDLIKDSDTTVIKYKYEFPSFVDLFWFLFIEMVKDNRFIKRCENCSRYFVPERLDAKYCNNNSPQNEYKTCREFINYYNFLSKSQNNEATKLHKQIYNSKSNKAKRCSNPQYNDELKEFQFLSAKWRSDIKAGIKSEGEYIDWLKSIKERKE